MNNNRTDEDIYNQIDQSPINQARPMVEMMIRLKNSMEKTAKAIDVFNNSSTKQTDEVIKLTKWLLYLTLAIGVLGVIQLFNLILK